MSDLCHNCGDCHLGSQPTPCPQTLNECIICKNFGHTFNFCPLSVRLVDKDYQYWMICREYTLVLSVLIQCLRTSE